MDGFLELLMGFTVLAIMLALYFIPSFIAFYRNHHNRIAVLVLNLLAGWTFIGWGAALVWSVTAVRKELA